MRVEVTDIGVLGDHIGQTQRLKYAVVDDLLVGVRLERSGPLLHDVADKPEAVVGVALLGTGLEEQRRHPVGLSGVVRVILMDV